MQATFASLLTSRRFAPLFVTQFLGAFNDNLLKSALLVLVTYRPHAGYEPASLVMYAGALFIAPFFLLSGVAGTLADQVDKAVIARWVKAAEIGIMVTGAAGLLWESVPLLLLTLFLLGTHSTVFGPIKYSLLPQHLASGELVAGNSLIEAGTFLAILLGTIVGANAVSFAQGPLVVGVVGVACAVSGWMAARAIPAAPPHVTGPLRVSVLRDSVAMVRLVTARAEFLLPVLAISWFWLVGATVVSGLPVFAKDVLYANEHMFTVMLALFAAGVGLGSYLAERWLHGEVSARHVPVAAVLMALSAIDLYAASSGRTAAADLLGPMAFVQTAGGWRVLVDLLVLSAAGGLFTVPLYALLQHRSEPEVRSRVIAGNNVVNAVAMTVGALVAAALLSRGMTMAELFALCGWGTVPVALIAAWILRRDVAKTAVRTVLRVLYRVEVHGLDEARAAFPRAVVAANHASFLDGLLLGAFLPGDPVFAVDTFIARQWWARPFLVFVNAMPVDPANPLSIRAMIRAVEGGAPCIIFPEGRITTTGSLMKV
jgi:acyl-[acyl-carrier-protein]-phospholipid O-acyltransferase/long-chain-fatty-acid--[acyl-carrier-protein] ligase